MADCLDGFHVSFRQSEIAQILLWQVRSLFEDCQAETHWEEFNEGIIFLRDNTGLIWLCLVIAQVIYKSRQRRVKNRSRKAEKDTYSDAAAQTGFDFVGSKSSSWYQRWPPSLSPTTPSIRILV